MLVSLMHSNNQDAEVELPRETLDDRVFDIG